MDLSARLGSVKVRLAALAIPCIAGLAYLASFGAPVSYVVVNAAAFMLALVWIVFGTLPSGLRARRIVSAVILVVLALPLATGPAIDGVTRWLSLGGFGLHVGMLLVPLLAVIASADRKWGAWFLLAAILIAFLQPDTATALALALASLAIAMSNSDAKALAVGVFGLFAAFGASFGGDLPPQPFVEGIIGDLAGTSPIMSVVLGASLLIGIATVAFGIKGDRPALLALSGALAGFFLAALVGSYPYPLIGYGAASILGAGLALGVRPTPAA